MRMHLPLGKPQPWVWPVTIVCLCFGGFVAFLTGAANSDAAAVADTSQMNREQLVALYSQALRENDAFQQEIDELRAKQNEMTDGVINGEKLKETLQQQIDELRVRAGTTPVQGPGIVIIIDDTGNIKNSPIDVSVNARVVHDSDLLTLVNELRSAGAEAIDVNGQRVVGSSAVRCAGPVIQVNNTQVAPPFRITAIGNPDTLAGAMNMPSGVLDWLRAVSIRVEVKKRDLLLVPAVKLLPQMQYSKPVLDDKTAGTKQ